MIPKCLFKVIIYRLEFPNVVSIYDLRVPFFTIFDVITILPKFGCYSIIEPLNFISCVFHITFITTVLHVIITLTWPGAAGGPGHLAVSTRAFGALPGTPRGRETQLPPPSLEA